MPGAGKLLSFLFGLEQRVDRRSYFATGVLLMALKVGGDLLILHSAIGRTLSFWDLISFVRLGAQVPIWALRALMVWALPFAWIGLSMSTRRAIDAGWSPWLGLLFCVPLLNFPIMIGLCLLPSRPPRIPAPQEPRGRTQAALRAVGASLLFAITMAILSVVVLRDYGLVLFAGTPLGMGVVTGYTFNRPTARSGGATLMLALATLVVAGAVLLLFAFEGVVCLLMALPLAVPLVMFGAMIGHEVAVRSAARTSPLAFVLLVAPILATIEPALRAERVNLVTSSVRIDAPPEDVWAHVVSFAPLPPPKEMMFRVGFAYPIGARIDGHGVGAIRHCDFSTGSFVEPITVWDEPRRLSFDVTEQPAPLRELTPYPRVFADHLHGSVTSRRGEFLLRPDAGGGTILEGRTWYSLSLFPVSYWSLWTDLSIHAIHMRVLNQIKAVTEAERGTEAGRSARL